MRPPAKGKEFANQLRLLVFLISVGFPVLLPPTRINLGLGNVNIGGITPGHGSVALVGEGFAGNRSDLPLGAAEQSGKKFGRGIGDPRTFLESSLIPRGLLCYNRKSI